MLDDAVPEDPTVGTPSVNPLTAPCTVTVDGTPVVHLAGHSEHTDRTRAHRGLSATDHRSLNTDRNTRVFHIGRQAGLVWIEAALVLEIVAGLVAAALVSLPLAATVIVPLGLYVAFARWGRLRATAVLATNAAVQSALAGALLLLGAAYPSALWLFLLPISALVATALVIFCGWADSRANPETARAERAEIVSARERVREQRVQRRAERAERSRLRSTARAEALDREITEPTRIYVP